MPCAAASSSMPRMCAVLCDHRLQPARREGRHRDVVFLVGRGRQAVDAGRMRERLVLARQRRRGDVRDHEAAVQAGVGASGTAAGRETLASISIAMRRSAIAPTSAIATRHRVGGERHRLGVEVAAATIASSPSSGEDQRVVGDGVGLAQQHQRGVAQLVEAGADRPAAGSAGSTGPARGRRPRGASGGSRCRRAARGSTAATSICPGWPRSAWMRGSNGPSLPRAASTVSAPITSAASSTGSNANSACSASAVEICVPLISARPSLAASTQRRDAGLAQRLGGRHALGRRRSISPSPISASVMCASGARSPEAPTEPWRRHVRHEAGVVHREQRVDHDLAHARVAARQARRLQREHQPHDRRRQRRADADAVRADQVALQRREVGLR